MDYRKLNNITGWLLFAISTIVYILTVERTASYWDCGEFIAVSYKLMVPHPPGAPFFLLMGRLFSFFALGDVESVAYWINMLSVLSSSFTILFLFWTITLLGRKLLKLGEFGTATTAQTLAIMGSGIVGALAYTFSDSFWFSAVEAEVYAMSSFFTAFVVWAILKWELVEDESQANKWLVLIAYMTGLSIGVHLLNLVTIPALALIFYLKKGLNETIVKITLWGTLAVGFISLFVIGFGFGALVIILGGFLLLRYKPGNRPLEILITLMISAGIIGTIMIGIIPGLPSIAGSFEIFFVNSLGLPFGSGIIVIALIVIGGTAFGIYHSQKTGNVQLNTAMLALAFILIGYSTYALVVIRSNFDPPIDENNPQDIMSVVSYLKREQYGDRPLLFGQYYDAELLSQEKGAPVYMKGDDEYEVKDYKIVPEYDPSRTTIFPRMYSTAPEHQQRYRQVMGLGPNDTPTFVDNVAYMFKHQIGTMYLRYFMFNFSGRESDYQNAGAIWGTDIFQDAPPAIESNRGRNNYFMIPLILGIIGLFFQYKVDKQGFAFVGMLFFLTGIALILYLNSPPTEPRERDYIYVGSYYAFSIWIGFAVMAIFSWFANKVSKTTAAGIATVICMSAPVIMLAENWDDHDRSERYFSVDSAKNFLASCAPNAIIFTGGDNDTFPLWYVQDVEGFRTDVRVVVLSYYNTDWYIEQTMRDSYESKAFPYTLTIKDYQQGGPNDYLPYYPSENISGAIPVKQYLQLIAQKHPQLLLPTSISSYHKLPSKQLYLDVNKQDVIKHNAVPEKYQDQIVDRMIWQVNGNGLEKKDLAILDLIATNNWERPIYFNNTSRLTVKMDLSRYMIQEGQAYRLIPVEKPASSEEFVNTEVMYDNLMNNFFYRELDNPETYYNEDYRKFVLNHRQSFNKLATAFVEEGNQEKAKEVIYKSLELMPHEAIPYDFTSPFTVGVLYEIGDDEKAKEIATIAGERAIEKMDYYERTNSWVPQEFDEVRGILFNMYIITSQNGDEELSNTFYEALANYNMIPSRNVAPR